MKKNLVALLLAILAHQSTFTTNFSSYAKKTCDSICNLVKKTDVTCQSGIKVAKEKLENFVMRHPITGISVAMAVTAGLLVAGNIAYNKTHQSEEAMLDAHLTVKEQRDIAYQRLWALIDKIKTQQSIDEFLILNFGDFQWKINLKKENENSIFWTVTCCKNKYFEIASLGIKWKTGVQTVYLYESGHGLPQF